MSFSDRIQALMEAFNLSPSLFAEKLQIQRSSLSHFFSGRNKPGWDFLEKLSLVFPEINLNWLLTGQGNMFVTPGSHHKTDTSAFIDHPPSPLQSSHQESIKQEKKPERVLLLYENGRFDIFEAHNR
ncbi:MAG: helix-turn-helix transcriptional regulator [Flavobacteriales bacterium]|nr:helix-turn-helix transcriptional regulator [Flavobacteriales bacterium]